MEPRDSTSHGVVKETPEHPEEQSAMKRGATIIGVVVSHRCARKLFKRIVEKKSQLSLPVEPTYRQEPKQLFNKHRAFTIVKDVIDMAFDMMLRYDPAMCSQTTQTLTKQITNRLRRLHLDRYRIIVLVTMGEKTCQGMQIASKCLWDTQFDTDICYCITNNNVYCVTNVYAVYKD